MSPFARLTRRNLMTAAIPLLSVLICVLVLFVPAPAVAQRADVLSPAYESVVRRYLSGDREGAVAEMVAWPEWRLRGEIPALNRLWQQARTCTDGKAANTWERVPVPAALMLLAVAADPSLLDARIRLGRVSWRLGQTAEARSMLEEVLTRGLDAKQVFLAHLFLGRIDEDARRFEDARAHYEAALDVDPRAQSARLALSHLRLRRGEAAGARAEVETALSSAGRRLQQDAFWVYPWGPAAGVTERLEALRREASS
jgi:tetratricopeptide (TPR) repeat protein